MIARVLAIALVLTVAAEARGAAPDAAVSNDAKAASRRHFETAEVHFRAGRFADALASYESGYKLAPLPGFLINIAHCHRLMGELRKSRAHYRKFLFVEPLSPRRAEIEQVIVELDRAIAEVEAAPAAESVTTKGTQDAQSRAAAADFWVWSAIAGAVVGPTVVVATLAPGG